MFYLSDDCLVGQSVISFDSYTHTSIAQLINRKLFTEASPVTHRGIASYSYWYYRTPKKKAPHPQGCTHPTLRTTGIDSRLLSGLSPLWLCYFSWKSVSVFLDFSVDRIMWWLYSREARIASDPFVSVWYLDMHKEASSDYFGQLPIIAWVGAVLPCEKRCI